MQLYYVVTILDRSRREEMEKLYQEMGLRVAMTWLGRGTAWPELLSMKGLSPTQKAVMATVADDETAHKLFLQTKIRLYIDIPGNGIMISIPIKAIGGAQTLAHFIGDRPLDSTKPDMTFRNELIYIVLNEGHSDEVMAAARAAGATGGTVIAAKGTGVAQSEKFHGLSLANEREVVLIVAGAEIKAAIMKNVIEQAGPQTEAGAICFSVPVSHVAGIRRIDRED
ncbi:MAG: P-II family nitrogen regulator [Clostridia bacterium]|nr:P-II family nitrogen regulator [Clostridia bacterium]